MAIGVPATLHHQRTQQQSPVPFSSFGPSPAFNQTFNGLPRSSVGMPNQGSNTNTQVRHPVQTIQNPGVGAQGTTMRPGGVTGNHQQRPAQPSLRSVSPSNIQSSTNHKFQPGSFRGPSVSSPSSPSPSQSQRATQPGSFPPTSGTDDGESSNHILSKRSIRDLVAQIDPSERLDPEVEDILVEVAEDFVESITTFGCSLAKHRKSTTLEAKDILLHLERNWNMTIPGFGGDEIKCYKKPLTNDVHKERLSLVCSPGFLGDSDLRKKNIKKSMAGAPEPGNAKSSAAGQSSGGHTKSHAPKAPLIGSPKLA
ncbi:unnamed protein product [Spirodela intermedia]|uniref:Transcription initiation factor TFIID subunit 12 domain-containing protein n=1 Tax=Spirodela intermedia TaxID=51605 RepID=A0A7I8KT92_SPIIN|nr:unnamed protein product [Spirodela intermedia]